MLILKDTGLEERCCLGEIQYSCRLQSMIGCPGEYSMIQVVIDNYRPAEPHISHLLLDDRELWCRSRKLSWNNPSEAVSSANRSRSAKWSSRCICSMRIALYSSP